MGCGKTSLWGVCSHVVYSPSSEPWIIGMAALNLVTRMCGHWNARVTSGFFFHSGKWWNLMHWLFSQVISGPVILSSSALSSFVSLGLCTCCLVISTDILKCPLLTIQLWAINTSWPVCASFRSWAVSILREIGEFGSWALLDLDSWPLPYIKANC